MILLLRRKMMIDIWRSYVNQLAYRIQPCYWLLKNGITNASKKNYRESPV